ncbi:hypothetical protein RRG08_038575 [Elysia crispata]|uniref:Uncharacterized protein n=1 Tax=Elysia crispata TaxID=231223 RepID=A0AAE1CY33_9GAST|nr:hypothetical protein RRG08_038575 [Elysia crispata]
MRAVSKVDHEYLMKGVWSVRLDGRSSHPSPAPRGVSRGTTQAEQTPGTPCMARAEGKSVCVSLRHICLTARNSLHGESRGKISMCQSPTYLSNSQELLAWRELRENQYVSVSDIFV